MSDPVPIDLENRDPNELNTNVKVAFEDVLGEPEGTQSIDCVWVNSYKCFTCGKNCCYKFMSTLCGICMGLYWGCEFAMITFNMVWCCTPGYKALSTVIEIFQRFLKLYIHCCCAPICEACGMIFSKITITKVS